MSEIKITNRQGEFANCSRRGCTTFTSRLLEVRRESERVLYHVCGHCQSAYSIHVDDALGLQFTPRHSAPHAKMGESPLRVTFPRDKE